MAHGQQGVETVQQLHDVGEVQPGGRFVEDKEASAAFRAAGVGGQFQPLGLAARERVGRLAEPHVVQPHVDQPFQPGLDLRPTTEKCERLADGHLQHVGDVPAAVGHFQDFVAVAGAVALGAVHVDVGQKLHVDLDVSFALAGGASPAVNVEAEVSGAEAPRAGLDRLGKHRPNLVERLQVRHRIGTRRAADRALVDHYHVVQLAVAENVVKGTRLRGVFSQPAAKGRIERVLDQRALARAAHAGHQTQHPQRELDHDVVEVVTPRSGQPDPTVVGCATAAVIAETTPAGQIIARETIERLFHFAGRALEDDLSAPLAGAGTDLDDLIGDPDDRLLVFDHHDGIAPVAKLLDGVQQLLDVAGV